MKVASPIAGLVNLCQLFPHHPSFARWYEAVELYTYYLTTLTSYTAPYHMIPMGLYLPGGKYEEQLADGVAINEEYTLRMFPTWGGFRGNNAIILSHALALLQANQLLNDDRLPLIAEAQLEWIVGKNPFNQSLMYGEGRNYSAQYSPMCGDMVGGLPVGIQTRGSRDIPYWSPAVLFNYKEIWVHPSVRWLAVLNKFYE